MKKKLPPIQARTANPLLDFTEGGEGGWSEVCETVTCLSDVQFRLLCQIVAQFCRWIFRKIYNIFFGFLSHHSETISIPTAGEQF